ncbi:LysM peptidoglycan-binding domain-containing protein [Paenisporosarcina sp. TG20]|uniref:LysM peptidoglycan-binding domain-containing protein n=1 Tax=Paenisporosarcina sp. TG20 TaxID=1211706 RepID=UPI0002EDB7E7|nr:LysM peptidoglycan-binding domain-containing protein [Paenisporosarcina sp. TG20]
MHVHVVQKGDTLWKISKQYGVSFDEVKRLNAHLANPDYIVAGMKIFVPEKSAKNSEMKEHPYNNGRPVKKNTESYMAPPTPKAIPEPLPKPMPYPTMPPVQKQVPPTPQPYPQPLPQQIPQPINQHLTMTQMMPPYIGIPYGWAPVADMDVHHPQALPTTQFPPVAPKAAPSPLPTPAPTPMPKPAAPLGWQLEDSSSLRYDESSSLDVPMYPQQLPQQYPQYHQEQPPCGCAPPTPAAYPYATNEPQTLGASQDYYNMMGQPNMMPQHMMPQANMMPQHMMQHPNMMPQHMAPYIACSPCHALPAPQGQWGYPTPNRYT